MVNLTDEKIIELETVANDPSTTTFLEGNVGYGARRGNPTSL